MIHGTELVFLLEALPVLRMAFSIAIFFSRVIESTKS